MKKKPKIAIVGRPNVGKSALFNRLCRKRIAIVDEAEGVTRDRLYAVGDFFGRFFEVIDTGGIDPSTKIPYQEEIRRQAEIAMEEADSIIMVVDGQVGVTSLDEEVAKILLRKEKKVCLAVNKIDQFSKQELIYPFYSLGISKVIATSATQGFHIAELLESALSVIPESEEEEEEQNTIKVAIVGRPNVGKSTFLNFLLQEERSVVGPVAGTTRDSIDAQLTAHDCHYTLIDTAGVRRKKKEGDVIEKFAAIRTERAIERADVCVLILDAVRGMTVEDKKIVNKIEEEGKGCILAFNKWDLVQGYRMEHCLNSLRIDNAFVSHCPTVFFSAEKGRNVDKILPAVKEVYENLTKRITTGQLNKFVEQAMQKYHPPMIHGKRLRVYYLAQVDVSPPRFVFFVNDPDRMTETYKKYLINQFREMYSFTGVPLIFALKGKKSKDEDKKAEETSFVSPEKHDFLEIDEDELFEEESENMDLDESYYK
ncbi:MAG: ribosome biogenesis GTPase Der [Rhabdochlamydiaceae bacterium]